MSAETSGQCPAGEALSQNGGSGKRLARVLIDEARCRGERCCAGACPANAIRGPFGKPQHIVERLCTRCLACAVACPYGAIVIE